MIPTPAGPARSYAGPVPLRARVIRAGKDIFSAGDVLQSRGRMYQVITVYRQAGDFTDYRVEEVPELGLIPSHSDTGFQLALKYLARLSKCLRGCL